MTVPRTLLVGLDAACWEYIDPLLKAGRLPNIEKLMNDGNWGVLQSTMPPWTPTAWSSLVTGKNAGKHGVFDMLRRKPGAYEFAPINSRNRQGAPFWKYLNDAGVRVGLVNVPFSYPPAPLDGFTVCGFGTPDEARDLTWPPDALAWIESRFGPYEPVVSTELLRSGRAEEILAAEKKHQARLIEVGLALAEHHQVDVLVINLMLTDHANHKMPNMELVHEAYLQSDADLGRLCNVFQPENVLLISDHGSSRLKGDFLLNVWLREHGYCVYHERTPAKQAAAFNGILKQWFHNHKGWTGRSEKVLRRLLAITLPRMPRAIQRRFWARIESALPFAEMHAQLSTMPDFSRTTVIPGSLYSGLLYFNVAGREPSGVIAAAERRALASRLKEELSQIREPVTGRRLFTNVFTPDELFHGPLAAAAPDIIVDAYWSQWNIRTRQPAAHKGKQHDHYFVTFDQHRDFGWHSPEGVFVFSGPAIQPGAAANGALKPSEGHLVDVPATLLHIYNVPAPEDWDGRVLLELLEPELRRRPIRTQPGDTEQEAVEEMAYSTEEADSMVRHLRALGYLD